MKLDIKEKLGILATLPLGILFFVLMTPRILSAIKYSIKDALGKT